MTPRLLPRSKFGQYGAPHVKNPQDSGGQGMLIIRKYDVEFSPGLTTLLKGVSTSRLRYELMMPQRTGIGPHTETVE